MENLGYLFYKDYYKLKIEEIKKILKKPTINSSEVYNGKLESKTKNIINFKLDGIENNLDSLNNFELKTTYPGLLIGSGYTHETGSEGEFKLGFQFDYTTGVPIIPGSSIKGALRSVFKHKKYIKEQFEFNEFTDDDIEKLEKNIFEGYTYSKGYEELVSTYKRDIFHDGVVKSKKMRILNDDYISPHGENPLKNPIPIKFLKVAPNVVFEFSFILNDFEYGKIKVTAKMKEELFKTIILDLGLGAKTNIGYGQFEKV